MKIRTTVRATVCGIALVIGSAVGAQTVGVTDSKIVIGGTHALSGPASAWSTIGRSVVGYFKMVNEKGGINGRQIEYLIRDDGYTPAKAVEQTRKLVEQDKVAFIATPMGSMTSLATRQYLNDNKVPQLFVAASSAAFNDPKNFPFTIGAFPSGYTEGREAAEYILKANQNAKIAFLVQNDDSGRDFGRGMRDVLGAAKAANITEVTFEVSDPTVDSQLLTLSATKAEALVIGGGPKVTTQAIRKAHDIGWKPSVFFVASFSTSVEQVLKPAGLDRAKGIVSATFLKDPTDPQWENDPGIKQWVSDMNKYSAGVSQDALARMGWLTASMTAETIRKAGKDLSRQNLLKQAKNLDMESPLLLPGLKVSTSPDNHGAIKRMRIQQFDGTRWNLLPQ